MVAGNAVYAAIDCGTNSTRLLAVDAARKTLTRQMQITRLGEQVDNGGSLSEAAIQRTLQVVRGYRAQLDQLGDWRCRVVATSAVRDASNGDRFLDVLSEASGSTAELLTGHEEARLSFAGAMSDLEPSPAGDLVVDIGGGSTELVYGTSGTVAAVTTQMGCVRITERFLSSDPPTQPEVRSAVEAIERELDDALHREPQLGDAVSRARLVGLAGTVSTLSALNQRLTEYDSARLHHSVLHKRDVDHWSDELERQPAADRLRLPGMTAGREDVIFGGALILREIMNRFQSPDCLVSESDILDGLVGTLLPLPVTNRTPEHPPVR